METTGQTKHARRESGSLGCPFGFEAWPATDLTKLQEGVMRAWLRSVNVGYDLQTMQDTVNALASFRRFFNSSSAYSIVGGR